MTWQKSLEAALAKHLTTRDVAAIVDLIHGWDGTKLTWDAICDAAERAMIESGVQADYN
jgi:hypothetical protein